MSGTDFDYDVGTLSPEGRIFQVEYAEKAVENSSTIAGVVCKDGVLLATEKIVINKMMISGTDKRVYSVTKNIGSVSYNALLFYPNFCHRSSMDLLPMDVHSCTVPVTRPNNTKTCTGSKFRARFWLTELPVKLT